MASGNFDIGTSKGLSVRINWSSTSNGTEANTSTVTAHLQIKKESSIPTLGTWSYRFTVGDDRDVTTKYASVGNSWVTLATKTVTVKHSADGTGSCYFWGRVTAPSGTTLSGVDISKTGTVTLDKIPQHGYITSLSKTEISAASPSVVVNYTNPAGSAIEDLQVCMSFDGTNPDIPYRAVSKTGTSHTFTLTASELAILHKAMSTVNSITLRVYIRSTLDGVNKYSYKTITFKISNTTINLSPTIKDTNTKTLALTGDENKLIKGHSTVSFSLSATPATVGSTITNQSLKNGGATYTKTSGTIYNVTDNSFVVWAKDTRGNSTTKTYTKTMIEYIPLTCNLTVDMPDINGRASFSVEGNYFNSSFGAVANTITVRVRQKMNGTWGSWQAVTISKSGNTYTGYGELSGFSQGDEVLVEAQAVDKLLTRTDEKPVLIIPVFDWSISDFNFNVPVTIQGDLTVTGSVSFDYGSQKYLWSGNSHLTEADTIYFENATLSQQANGIVLVFSRSNADGTPLNYGWNTFYIPKCMPDINLNAGQTFIMAASCFAAIGTKYVYIRDDHILGNAENINSGTANGISYNNSLYVLRYIIGV